MSIPLNLLAATESRAPGIGVYGGAGMKKTHAACTLPPPVLHLDIGEGGTGSILPWVHRRRNSDSKVWTTYTQAQREHFLSLCDESVLGDGKKLLPTYPWKPKPCVDVIHFDNTRYDSYQEMVEVIGNFDHTYYNSLSLDSLHEYAVETQTFAKGKDGFMKLMNDVAFSWVGAQERAFQGLRRLRNYRDNGVFIYLVGSEDIAKDYVKNPMEKRDKGETVPEAYSVRGTVLAPGALANGISHIPDVLCHTKLVNGAIVWVTEPEMLPGGGAHWDAKDRFGRLKKWENANIISICRRLYGVEGANAIYDYALGCLPTS